MLIVNGLLVAAALAQSATAFFMWFPDYRCIKDHTCISSKRGVDASVEQPGADSTLRIVQRRPRNSLPHDVQVQRLAERLTRKYARGSRAQPKVNEGQGLLERSNEYPISSAATPTQTNSAAIDQDGTDFSYFAQVLLGSEDTPLYMLLDTGAGTSWVMGSSCTSAPCQSHNTFGASDSKTFQISPQAFSISYGSGAVSGTMATDNLSVAGLKLSVTFGIANKTSDDFNAFPIDGILGLSQEKSTTPNFLQTLVASKALRANIFGVDLNRSGDGPNTGEINFGAPDTTRFSGSLGYLPVASSTPNDWAIAMDDFGLGTTQAGIKGRLAYIDTGTSYIFGPPAEVSTFHGLVDGSKSSDGVTYTVPCTTTTPASVTFAGTTYSILAKDWVGPITNGACTSNIYGHAVIDGAWLLGDTFLKNVYAVFDVDQNRIGFATQNAVVNSSVAPTVASPPGGPNSLSDSSSLPRSSNGVTATGPPDTATQTTSNASITGSSSANSSMAGSRSGSPTKSPGFSGHHTAASSGTLAAETSSAPSASPSKSIAVRLESGLITTLYASIALITLFS